MGHTGAALFYLGTHNEVDQIAPVLYKLGDRENIDVDVVLENKVTPEDFRLAAVNEHENVTMLNRSRGNSQLSTRGQIYELIKDFSRKIPTDVPRELYHRYAADPHEQRYQSEEFPDKDHGVVGFDWSHSAQMSHLLDRDDVTTVVFPHGDDPYVNKLVEDTIFDNFLSDESNFEHHTDRDSIKLHPTGAYAKHDYQLFSNELTASRMPESTPRDKIKIYGSPRYSDEWLNVLSEIRPDNSIDTGSDLDVVFFLRREGYTVSTRQVEKTLKLLDKFDELSLVVKEHPRARLLDPATADEMDDVDIVKDGISSASLIEWGDVFLSLGTSITFEPVVRRKPVLSTEYAHANQTVISSYFQAADIRCLDGLYHTIHELLTTGTDNFYDDSSHRAFTEEIITSGHESVLDTWARFIESKV